MDLDLCIIDSNQVPYCISCVEKKLNAKIIRSIHISGQEFMKLRDRRLFCEMHM
jgi:hypothetical protein